MLDEGRTMAQMQGFLFLSLRHAVGLRLLGLMKGSEFFFQMMEGGVKPKVHVHY